MKSLILVRHAKSSWDFDVEDVDRPLNHRGLADAPAMAERLVKKEIKIDAFISSPAKRATGTAAFFAEAYGQKFQDIITIPELYEATAIVFQKVVENLQDEYENVALFSHNPGITDFVNILTSVKTDDMPTCSVFAVKANAENWRAFADAAKEFWFFDCPKAV